MMSPPPARSSVVETLESLLDDEASLLDVRRSQLHSLRGAIVDRDDEAVERLLRQIERAQELQSATDEKLNTVRRALAEQLGCPASEVKLSALIAELPKPLRGALADRRQRIIDLAERLQIEHMRTVMLLGECARINRLLMESLFPDSRGVTTYSTAGSHPWHPEGGLVDAER